MKKNTRQAIIKSAELARLEIRKEDMEKYAGHAEKVIKYFEKLGELNITNVEPTSHAQEKQSQLREDRAIPFEGVSKILSEMPEMDGPFLQVPKVI